MKYSRIPVALLVIILIILVPASASLTKIRAGAVVFIGESNMDISSALNGYTMIAWWPPGADMSTDPAKVLTITNPTQYTFDPDDFSGYTGTWYTYGKQPYNLAFTIIVPQIDLKIWDVDHNMDVTGQSIPLTTNITYRIDTNLWQALNYTYRPNANPSDSSFLTVTLVNPLGTPLSQVYTGDLGAQNTRILPFDSNPGITSTPYYGKNLPSWDHLARSTVGSIIYPAGIYTFSVAQNLNGMSGVYSTNASVNPVGLLTSGDKTVTFLPAPTPTPSASVPQAITTASPEMSSVQTAAGNPGTTVVPVNTTYSPLPAGTVVTGVGIAILVFITARRRS